MEIVIKGAYLLYNRKKAGEASLVEEETTR